MYSIFIVPVGGVGEIENGAQGITNCDLVIW
jgi:hypothetical protein